jgi:hypothetical protein
MTNTTPQACRKDLEMKLSLEVSPRTLIHSTALAYNENPTPDNTFSYAYALSRSSVEADRRFGISLFSQLIGTQYSHALECLYSQSLAHYQNGDFAAARACAESILRSSPDHVAARQVHLASVDVIDKNERDMNIAVGTSAVVMGISLVVGIASMLLSKKK